MPENAKFDHYEVLTRDDGSLFELGRGAMGITYKAFDTNLRCNVALKVINAAYLDSEVARQRFIREARAAAQLRNRHVASVFHLGIEADAYFYAMEFIDGETVDSIIKRQGPLEPRLALQIAGQVARALSAAQKHQLVHRDIKPSNLMLVHEDDEVVVKVIDFGLAKTSGGEDYSSLSMPGFVGTPHFASPEQLNEKPLDVRSDIYSLGATIWYMLTGKPPFSGSVAQVMSQHLHQPPPFETLRGVPAPVVTVLKHLLEKDAALRPQTPTELRKEVDQCLEAFALAPTETAPAPLPLMTPSLQHAAEVPHFEPGSVVAGRYRIKEHLGEGNNGEIFCAEHLELGAEVRLVALHSALTADREMLTQIEREVETLAGAPHVNLLRLYSLERWQDISILVLEGVHGFSLVELLRARRELAPAETLLLLEHVASATDYAIQHGLKRLDFSLHQVMIAFPQPLNAPSQQRLLQGQVGQWPEFTLKLNPLAMNREQSNSETWAGGQTILGDFAAPARAAASADVRARYIQSVGAIAYELLGGVLSPLMLAASGTAQPAPRYVPLASLPEKGNEILRRAMNPAQSFGSAAEFLHALKNAEHFEVKRSDSWASVSSNLPRPEVPAASSFAPISMPVAEPVRRRRFSPAMAGIICLLVITAAAGGYWVWRQAGDRELSAAAAPARVPETSSTEAGKTGVEESAEPMPEPAEPPLVATTTLPARSEQGEGSIVKPPPPPKRRELKVAVSEAEQFEANGQWVQCIEAYLRIAKEYPESDVSQVNLEMILRRFRESSTARSEVDFDELRSLLIEAAKLDVLSAMMLLGEELRKTEPATAFNWYSAAAAKGHPQAITQMGLMLARGMGVERDLKAAVDAFAQASEKGDAEAKFALGECYLFGRGVPPDETKAIGILHQAASAGSVRAMDLLGTCYHKGKGTKRDFEEAFRLFSEAVELGHWHSAGNLGVLYMNGEGPKRNPQKAIELFQKGVREGDDYCMYLYATCLIDSDKGEAEKWFRKAAAAGNRDAIEWLQKNKKR